MTRRTKIDCTSAVNEYIDQSDWRVKANANIGFSNAGLVNNLAGKIIANYWLDNVLSQEEGEAHRNGDVHIHDLDCLTPYCAGWSLRVLLDEGFNGVRGRVNARPPNNFRAALSQMANFFGILQSEWAGAQAFSSFDTYLAPYIFKEQLTVRDIKKGLLSFIYNLNVPSRWGQSPFTNVTIDWTVPEDLRDQIPTKNQKHLFTKLSNQELLFQAQERDHRITRLEDMTYKHFQPELDKFNKAFYELLTEGDSSGQPFTFPIPTVNITEDFDWSHPNCDILFENTAKIGSSYFQNFIGSQYIRDESGKLVPNERAYKPNAVRSMCCRLQLDLRELLKRGGGLFGSAELTGSIGVVTINLARIGYTSKTEEEIFQKVDELSLLAKGVLEKRRVFVTERFNDGLYPYTKRYLKNFNSHFSTIGINGANEMLLNFNRNSGKDYKVFNGEGLEFLDKLMEHMRSKMIEFQEETGNLYNLEASPAEGAVYRFAKEDKKRYPDIIQSGDGDKIYYTNSTQLPANYTDDPFEALDLQDNLQCKYTGGTVLHLYMRERLNSAESCKKLVKNVISNYRMPYITITPVFSICPKHGYLAGEHEYCPHCDAELAEEMKREKNNK